jgi:hypothetical protein
LVRDGAVPDQECWYRVLTNEDYITRHGTVHYQASKKGAFRRSTQKPWAHELSGRLSSLVTDILGEAEAAVTIARSGFTRRGQPIPRKICFVGVACATASKLRAGNEIAITTDVVYTPLDTDNAHSDFVTYGTMADEELDPVRDWLREGLRVIRPQDVEARVASCGAIPGPAT